MTPNLPPLLAPLALTLFLGLSVESVVNVHLIRTDVMTPLWRHVAGVPSWRHLGASSSALASSTEDSNRSRRLFSVASLVGYCAFRISPAVESRDV